jgi:acetylornithine deacetylase/succinyl-diaminopimelate desuccinylase-like protein
MPTSEGLGQVPKMAEYLAGQFRAAGFPDDDIHIVPLGETASLVVRYRGTGRGGRPILLNAHMDVVTANRSDWKRDPFELQEEGGYYFGRGTWDDKLDVATITTTFLRLRHEGFVPQRDLIIAFTGDEETRMQTAQDLLHNHRDLVDAEFCLSGDMGQGVLDEVTGRPLYYQVSGAEKLYAAFAVTVTNAGGHSAYPRADNAIYELADALKKIQGYRFPVMWNDWTREGFRQQGPRFGGVVGAAMSQFALDPKDAAANRVLSAEPEQVGQIGTTCVPTLLSGGHALNALPQSASAAINCRVFPGTSAKDVQDQLQRLVGPGAVVTMTESSLESSPSPLREDIMAAVAAAVHATHPGVPLVPHMEVGTSDGAAFRNAGIPTYGVQGLFIKLSQNYTHGLDERMDVRSLPDGLTHWYTLLKHLAGGGAGRGLDGKSAGPARRAQ